MSLRVSDEITTDNLETMSYAKIKTWNWRLNRFDLFLKKSEDIAKILQDFNFFSH